METYMDPNIPYYPESKHHLPDLDSTKEMSFRSGPVGFLL